MSAKHTPGPWEYRDGDDNGFYPVGSDTIVGIYAPGNRDVVAASPEMYKALKAVLNVGRGSSGRLILELDDEDIVKAAIAKAEGKTS